MLTITQLVQTYSLQPHPEGGWYKENYRAAETIEAAGLPTRFKGERSFSTAIYFLLESGQFSAFHRILSDEVWHFYAGKALEIFVIHPAGLLETIRLGSNIEQGESFQAMVPAGTWFASRPIYPDSFSFVGCTVAPGFDFSDFELANGNELAASYPEHAALIMQLTR
jgi:predicted cupin superfamily sugar epimerase